MNVYDGFQWFMMIPGVRLTMAYIARLASYFCFKAEQIQKAEKRLSDAKASELEDNDAVVAAKKI